MGESDVNDPITLRAARVSAMLHRGQTDRRGEEYAAHPRRVAARLVAVQAPEPVVCAAFLHDVVEDTQAEVEDVHALFGARVANLVRLVTRPGGVSYVEYVERLADDSDAVCVKVADLLDNLDPARADGLSLSLKGRYDDALRYLVNIAETCHHDDRVRRLVGAQIVRG